MPTGEKTYNKLRREQYRGKVGLRNVRLDHDWHPIDEPIHNRMPVILPKESYASWLNPSLNNTVYLSGLLGPYPAEEMEAYPISTLVNNPRNDSPLCIHPFES